MGILLALLLAAAPASAWLPDVRPLIDQARQLRPGQGRPQGGSYGDSSQALSEAAIKLQEVAAFTASLDSQSRELMSSLSPEDRATLEKALAAVYAALQQAIERNERLSKEVLQLAYRVGGLEAKLLRLQTGRQAALAELQGVIGDVAALQATLEERRDQLSLAKEDLRSTRQLTREARKAAQAAQLQYWKDVRRLYKKEVPPPASGGGSSGFGYEEATTDVQQIYEGSGGPVVQTTPNVTVTVAELDELRPTAVAMPVRDVDVLPPSGQTTKDTLRATLIKWAGAMAEARQANDTLELLGSLQNQRARELEAEAQALAEAEQQLQSAVTDRKSLAEQTLRVSLELTRTADEVREQVAAGLDAFREHAYWDLAREGLLYAVSPAADKFAAANHFVFMANSWRKLLSEDLPAAVEVLGPNPSEEALAKYERLQNLTASYTAEYAMSMWMAGADMPALKSTRETRRLLRYDRSEKKWISGEGVVYTGRRQRGSTGLGPPRYETAATHLMHHAKGARTAGGQLIADVRSGYHSVIDVEPSGMLAFTDEVMAQIKAGGANVVARPASHGRTEYTVEMYRTVGYLGGVKGNAEGRPACSKVKLVLENGTEFVTMKLEK